MRRFLVLMLAGLLLGCAGDFADAGAPFEPGVNNQPAVEDAHRLLINLDIKGANAAYERAAQDGDPQAQAAAAVTRLLLLPYSAASEQILGNMFGANGGLDTRRDIIYGEQGLLYWLSRGKSPDEAWEIIERDLPFPVERLSSWDAFFTPLVRPMDVSMDGLEALAREIHQIVDGMERASADGFQPFFLPGEIFHSQLLTLRITPNDLRLIGGGLSLGEAALYFVSAYEHAWSLSVVLGQGWQDIADDPQGPEDLRASTVAAYLDQRFARGFRAPANLAHARSAAARGFRTIALSLRESEMASQGVFSWNRAASHNIRAAAEFLEAISVSIESPIEIVLPNTTPNTSAQLSELFESRLLDEEVAPFHVENDQLVLNKMALEAFFIDDIFRPGFPIDAPFVVDGDPAAIEQDLTADLRENIDEAWFKIR